MMVYLHPLTNNNIQCFVLLHVTAYNNTKEQWQIIMCEASSVFNFIFKNSCRKLAGVIDGIFASIDEERGMAW